MKPFTSSTAYKNEEMYNIITDEFNDLKSHGIFEDWVEYEDMYIDEKGDVYAVEHYHTEYFKTEGHGEHELPEQSPDIRSAKLVISYDDVMAKYDPENASAPFIESNPL